MRSVKDRVKSFFIEPTKQKEKQTEDPNSMYVVKLKDNFKQQFPMKLKPYVQADTLNEGSYVLTDKIYKNSVYGFKVLFTLEEANKITKKLYSVPLEVIHVSNGEEIEEG